MKKIALSVAASSLLSFLALGCSDKDPNFKGVGECKIQEFSGPDVTMEVCIDGTAFDGETLSFAVTRRVDPEGTWPNVFGDYALVRTSLRNSTEDTPIAWLDESPDAKFTTHVVNLALSEDQKSKLDPRGAILHVSVYPQAAGCRPEDYNNGNCDIAIFDYIPVQPD